MNVSLNDSASQHKTTPFLAYVWVFVVTSIFLVALILKPVADTQAELAVAGTSIVLPGLCQFKRMFGRDCPGCGMTRSFMYIARFQPTKAWAIQPVGTLLAFFLAASIPHRIWQIVQLHRGRIIRSTIGIEVSIVLTLAAMAYLRWFWQLV